MRVSRRRTTGVAAAIALAGAALVACVALLGHAWFSRHVFQFYFAQQERDVAREWGFRGLAAATGIALIAGALPLARRLAPATRGDVRRFAAAAAPIAIAVLLALVVSEMVMRRTYAFCRVDPRQVRQGLMENRIGTPDPRYGWVYLPSRTTPLSFGLRPSTFAVNALGFRAPSQDVLPDRHARTILFTGESIAAGHGIDYPESFPAIVGDTLGLQTVNLSMHGYGSDQAYLRLADALGTFDRVAAAVTLFVPAQLERNVFTFRPHLVLAPGGTLTLAPALAEAAPPSVCLLRVACALLPYHDDGRLEVTAAILRASDAAVRARGAVSLFVVPSVGPDLPVDTHLEGWLLRELFDRAGLAYVVVDIDRSMLLPAGDVHPDARGSRKIADAVSARLRAEWEKTGRTEERKF
jgi:hypothetical protein